MSDALAGGMQDASGAGRGMSNGAPRPFAPASGPHHAPSGVRSPRDIMRDREAREARRKAETEAREREREEEERRRAQEERRRSAERRAAAAAGVARAGEGPAHRQASGAGGIDPGARMDGPPQVTDGRHGDRLAGAAARASLQAGAPPNMITTGAERTRIVPPEPTGVAAAPTAAAGPGHGSRAPPASNRPQVGSSSEYNQRAPQPQPQPQPQQPVSSNLNRTAVPPPQPKPVTGQGQPGASAATQAGAAAAPGPEPVQQRSAGVSSFPHAFERWETLSSHWEGLTSYWIRRLEQNKDEVSREPLAQQMSRQITDLSAAGANLFHAVVELQRLRASSERKFQRWFFETRAEQERARELQAELEKALIRERQQRLDLAPTLAHLEHEKANADKMVAEMKRELQISKEEARRAWEELGRREQEERERTTALKEGQPTIIGGIHVVPMGQAGMSVQGSINRPTTREGPHQGGFEASPTGTFPEGEQLGRSPVSRRNDGGPTHQTQLNLEDPFLEAPRPSGEQSLPNSSLISGPPVTNGSASATGARTAYPSDPQHAPRMTQAAAPATTGLSQYAQSAGAPSSNTAMPFYQHQGSSIQGPGQVVVPPGDSRSFVSHPSEEGTVSEEEYEYDGQGQYRLDAQGRPILFRRGVAADAGGEYGSIERADRDDGYGRPYGGMSGTQYAQAPPSTAPMRGGVTGTGWSGTAPDYSGSAYGSGWESLPRHHHPTRLSDVLEEDERSRTSPSRASQTSRR